MKKKDICIVCGSKKTNELYPENIDFNKLSFTYEFSPQSQKTFRVVRCLACTHVFCSPLPNNLYKNYEDVVDKEYLRHVRTRELSSREVLKTVNQFSSGQKLLDVGCATGDFLKIAKESGYDVEGLELSHWSAEIAKKRGFKIYRKTLKALASRIKEKYDVITLWGVIEHFEYPKEEMIYINKLLKPNGILVLWTGNVDGMMSKVLGRKWWYWQGQHIQYFTVTSIDKLANKTGFKTLANDTYPIAATYEQMENSLTRYKFQKVLLPFLKAMFSIKKIWYLKFPGEMLYVARKTKK